MLRFDFVALAVCIFGMTPIASIARAEEPAPPMKQVIYKSYFVSYMSWLETMELSKSGLLAEDYAQFYGVGLGMTRERFWKGHWGHRGEIMALYGQANGGGSQAVIPYQRVREAWYGASISYRGSYRLTPQMTVSIGPVVVYRQIKWSVETEGMEVKSGTPVNYGALADFKYRLSGRWELRQTIGTLATKASTVWSLSLGYHY